MPQCPKGLSSDSVARIIEFIGTKGFADSQVPLISIIEIDYERFLPSLFPPMPMMPFFRLLQVVSDVPGPSGCHMAGQG